MRDKIDMLIKESILKKDSLRTLVLRDIKSNILKEETSKNFKTLDTNSLVLKMKKDRETSAKIYQEAGRLDLADKELKEIFILEEFLPKEASEEDIRLLLSSISLEGVEISSKNMGVIMKKIKETFPNVDMKLSSNIVKSFFK